MCFRDETWSPDVRKPDLNRPQPLSAQPLAVLVHSIAAGRHDAKLHATPALTRGIRGHDLGGWRR